MCMEGPRGSRLTPQYNPFSSPVLKSKLSLINAHVTWPEIPSPTWVKTSRENDEHCGYELETAARYPMGGMVCEWKEQKEIKTRDKRVEETGGAHLRWRLPWRQAKTRPKIPVDVRDLSSMRLGQ
jgi:hypothetical protein